MSVVIIEREVVHYEVLGRGRPLILLHGWVGSWRYWIPTMQAISTNFRTYAFDLWGFGDTAKTSGNYSFERQLALIDHFLQEMGIGKAALIGHGLGAVLAITFASRYPTLVDRLMAACLPAGLATIHPRLSKESPAALAEWLRTATIDRAMLCEAEKTDPLVIQRSLAELEKLNLVETMQTLNTPILYIFGLNDPLVQPPSEAQIEAQTNPLAHTIFFDASGHFPMLEEASKFNRLMFDFLALPSRVSPRQLQLKEEWKRRVR